MSDETERRFKQARSEHFADMANEWAQEGVVSEPTVKDCVYCGQTFPDTIDGTLDLACHYEEHEHE